jgi:hypothetical protein
MVKFRACRALCAGVVVMGLSVAAYAEQAPYSGLGLAWPNAQDVSSSVHWHVYAFTSNGIRYVQINDAFGHVRGAVANIGGQFLVLPMGRDASRISTPQQPVSLSATVVPLTAYTETLYDDGVTQLQAVPLSTGDTLFTASPAPTTAAAAADTPCNDPVECNTHIE